jgi:hypothetical protein
MNRVGIRPEFSFGLARTGEAYTLRRRYPFRRSPVAILVLLVFDVVFLIPAISTLLEAISLWRQPDELFSVVAALFVSFWLLGWSMAPLLITAILVLLICGREELRAGPGRLELLLGLPGLGITLRYDAASVRNLRIETPQEKSGRSWRGSHLVFDYGAGSHAFGSDVAQQELDLLGGQLEQATGLPLRRGDASAGELEWVSQENTAANLDSVPPRLPQDPPEKAASAPGTGGLSTSVLVLIAANLVPLAGAVFWDWNLGAVLALYWAESAIIGLFNVARIIVVARWMALLAAPFFVGHFGGFMAVHFLFLYTIFIEGGVSAGQESGSLDGVVALFVGLWPALLALFLSHGYSFLGNFLGRAEFRGSSVQQQMSQPYSRIIFMHLVLILGGGLALVLGEPTPVLMLVIALKIALDVRAHRREHAKAASLPTAPSRDDGSVY